MVRSTKNLRNSWGRRFLKSEMNRIGQKSVISKHRGCGKALAHPSCSARPRLTAAAVGPDIIPT